MSGHSTRQRRGYRGVAGEEIERPRSVTDSEHSSRPDLPTASDFGGRLVSFSFQTSGYL